MTLHEIWIRMCYFLTHKKMSVITTKISKYFLMTLTFFNKGLVIWKVIRVWLHGKFYPAQPEDPVIMVNSLKNSCLNCMKKSEEGSWRRLKIACMKMKLRLTHFCPVPHFYTPWTYYTKKGWFFDMFTTICIRKLT